MDRSLTTNTDQIRFRIDATRCDGQGVCVLIAPEIFELDRYGDAYVIPGSERLVSEDPDIRARGLEADAMCPRNAISEEIIVARAVVEPPETVETVEILDSGIEEPPFVPRLVLEDSAEVEPLDRWRERGGWKHQPDDVLELLDAAGLTGHGGAGFPTASKWRRVIGSPQPVVVANGAEREPGTEKDRYLLAHRPSLVLNGLVIAMHGVGAKLGIMSIDEDAHAAADQFQLAVDDATREGLLEDLEIRLQRVPTRYVAGEETALLTVIEGGLPIPRMRPPYPSDVGVFGRPTLVQNVETLAQLAIVVAQGPAAYCSVGVPGTPGSGVFTIGKFGGPFIVTERPFGYSLRDLLEETGLLAGARAVLVGGYAGGLLAPDALDVPLTPVALRAAGASLGTKSVQVLTADMCPVRVVADIVGYFGEQTADQCPPCSRGLPDMAGILRDLEAGTGGTTGLAELETFMGTLSGRGVCRLPDGAARIVFSLLTNFAEEVAAHAAGGGPAHSH